MGTALLVYSAEGDTFVLNALDPGLGASRWKSKGPQGWSVWQARVDGVVMGVGVRDDDDLLFVGTQGGVVFAVRIPQREP